MNSDVDVQHYQGPKKPNMPASEATLSVLPLKMLSEQVIMRHRARCLDFQFMKTVTCMLNSPEFGGFNTMLARERGQRVKPETTAMYTPLIDMALSVPDTMMTGFDGYICMQLRGSQ